MRVVDASERDVVTVNIPMRVETENTRGIVQGALLVAAGLAAAREARGATSTGCLLWFSAEFLRPVPAEVGELRALVRPARSGRRFANDRVELLLPDGRIAAIMTTAVATDAAISWTSSSENLSIRYIFQLRSSNVEQSRCPTESREVPMTVERFPVEAGHVLMFRRALGHDDAERGAGTPADLPVPATFVQASAQFDPDYPLRPKPGEAWFGSASGPGFMPDGGGGLHAEQHYHFHQPVRVGMVLSAAQHAGKTWEKTGRSGTLHFSELITEYVDESGAPVVTSTSVGVRRQPAVEASS